MDFSVWSFLEAKACEKIHYSVDVLKQSLLRAWQEQDTQEQLRASAEDVFQRLPAVIKSNGSHFE